MPNPQAFLREGFQSSPSLFEIYNKLIERSLHENIVNKLFTKLQINVDEFHFNVEQFKYLLTELAITVNWNDEQRSLINNLLVQYGFEQIL